MLMADATEDCLTTSLHQDSGNVDQLVIAMRKARVALVSGIDGEVLKNTKENIVLRVAYSLDEALDAASPKEVAEGVLERISSLKHAPRVNKAGCTALEASLRREASSFAARDVASADKVRVVLGDLPIRDDAEVKLRAQEYKTWTGAPPAKQVAVWSGLAFDSRALGTTAPPKRWSEWLDRPTVVAAPLTELDGVELGKIKEMEVLAKMLRTGEKIVESKKRKRSAPAPAPRPSLGPRDEHGRFRCPAGCSRTFAHAPAAANHGKSCAGAVPAAGDAAEESD